MNRSISKQVYRNIYWVFLSHWYNIFDNLQYSHFLLIFIAQFNTETMKFIQSQLQSQFDEMLDQGICNVTYRLDKVERLLFELGYEVMDVTTHFSKFPLIADIKNQTNLSPTYLIAQLQQRLVGSVYCKSNAW